MIARALLTSMLLLAGCSDISGSDDITSGRYASFEEASKAGVLESGWLPRALPKSATNIVEVHNIDSNELWAKFLYSNDDIRELAKGCISKGVQFPDTKRTKRDVAWWPAELTNAGDTKSRRKLMLLSCQRMQHAQSEYRANLAVDTTNRIAWYWIVR